METNEAAAALLNMESPNNILDEKRMSKPSFVWSKFQLGMAGTNTRALCFFNFSPKFTPMALCWSLT